MCNVTFIHCEKCSGRSKNIIEICGKYGTMTLCINYLENMNQYVDMPEWKQATLDLSRVRRAVGYPGKCYPECPSMHMVMREDFIKIFNGVGNLTADNKMVQAGVDAPQHEANEDQTRDVNTNIITESNVHTTE